MIYIPREIHNSLIILGYAFSAIIIFLWGKAIGYNETAEAFKIADKKRTVEKLRLENDSLKHQNNKLKRENENLEKWKHIVKKAIEVK